MRAMRLPILFAQPIAAMKTRICASMTVQTVTARLIVTARRRGMNVRRPIVRQVEVV